MCSRQRVARVAIDQSDQAARVAFTHHGIALPITDTAFLIHDGWTQLNAHAVIDRPALTAPGAARCSASTPFFVMAAQRYTTKLGMCIDT